MHESTGMKLQRNMQIRSSTSRDRFSRSGFFGVLAGIACALFFVPASVRAATTAADYAEERRALEYARYLHAIEGDTAGARVRLDRLAASKNSDIRTQALYLRARLLEEQGDTKGAARMYRSALDDGGLEPGQKQRVIARLLALDPSSVRPFRDAGKTRGLPSQVFEVVGRAGSEYVLAGAPGESPRLQWQDASGMLNALRASIPADEEILDALPDRILTRSVSRQRVIVRRAPGFAAETVIDRFAAEEGDLLNSAAAPTTGSSPNVAGSKEAPTPAPTEYLVLGAQGLRYGRGAQILFTHPLPGSGCRWNPSAPRARQGIIFCPGQGLYRVDLIRRALSPLPLTGEVPSDIVHAGEYLVMRYADRIEVRRGPAFDHFSWGFPAGLQDPIALGRGHAFVSAVDGPIRAFVLRTGQLDWMREESAAMLRVQDGELLVLTHARVLLAIDERGRRLYTYEPGWDDEDPILLPGREWLVVHNADGSRIRIDRELLRLTGGSRDYLLVGARASAARGDRKGALRALDAVLALEHGNGTAWREKATLLAATGAARSLQTRAWTQAARSQNAAPWSADPSLTGLAKGLGASWIWKREAGPRFFPVLTGGRTFSFYVENDNQTVVVLDNRNGGLKATFRFPEPLDLKVATWAGDTLIVSSPTRIYLMAPGRGAGLLGQIALRGPVCNAILVPTGLLVSDWNGNLQLFNPASRLPIWETRLGRGGLLLANGVANGIGSTEVDVFEIEGGWHRLRLSDGSSIRAGRMPPGTITEVHAGRDFAYAGYNEGLVVAMDRAQGTISWQRDMGEQIFSMSGRGDQMLLVGTASKRVLNLHGRTGLVQAQANISTYLFNRPLLTKDGYWVGTTEPALEKRSLTHALLQKFPLTEMPGTPSQAGGGIAVSTLDNFILVFPGK
jgi:outer membrane protein assembly factor BamB